MTSTGNKRYPVKTIIIKYCGGCNPVINRSKIVDEVKQGLPPDISLVKEQTPKKPELGIMMCGCSSACLDREEIRRLAPKWIVVGGNYVDLFPVNPDRISLRIIQIIRECCF
jgi:hypothetical protein